MRKLIKVKCNTCKKEYLEVETSKKSQPSTCPHCNHKGTLRSVK
jgi:DNA-directed RNA polymerase subunit RPC12/RpoP